MEKDPAALCSDFLAAVLLIFWARGAYLPARRAQPPFSFHATIHAWLSSRTPFHTITLSSPSVVSSSGCLSCNTRALDRIQSSILDSSACYSPTGSLTFSIPSSFRASSKNPKSRVKTEPTAWCSPSARQKARTGRQLSRQQPHPRLHRSNNFVSSPFKSESSSVGSSLTLQLQLELIMVS
jgi:hypothetical protein